MTRKLVRPHAHDKTPGSPDRAPDQPGPAAPTLDEVKPLPPDAIEHSSNRLQRQHRPRPRLHFLSNLRIFLTVLVIFHHTAIPYGGLGSWNFNSRSFLKISPALAAFNALNQTFFMALFVWMAGYFAHIELDKLGEREKSMRNVTGCEVVGVRLGFVAQRAQRLLLPAVFYTLAIEPAIKVMVELQAFYQGDSGRGCSTSKLITSTLWAYFSNLRGIRGPVWLPALVWIFDTLAAMTLPLLLSPPTDSPSPDQNFTKPNSWKISQCLRVTFLALSILTSYRIRTISPIGTNMPFLNLQPAYLPQYIFAYTAGHVSAGTGNIYCYSFMTDVKHRPLRRLLFNTLKLLWLLVMICAIAAAHASLRHPGWTTRAIQNLSGGHNKSVFLYAAFNEVGFVSIGASVVAVFEKYLNRPWMVRRRKMARYCYATFLVHVVVSVGVELVVELLMGRIGCALARGLGSVGMTIVVGVVNVVASWGLAMVLCERTWMGRWV